jgi:RNA polymerase sigma-70 factor (ECF subfamily)
MLERLTPAERATYLLRTAFDYPYRRIAEVLHLGVDHARQLVRRAHEAITAGRRRPVDTVVHRRLVRTFLAAAQTGDLGELEELLAVGIAQRPLIAAAEAGRSPVPDRGRSATGLAVALS